MKRRDEDELNPTEYRRISRRKRHAVNRNLEATTKIESLVEKKEESDKKTTKVDNKVTSEKKDSIFAGFLSKKENKTSKKKANSKVTKEEKVTKTSETKVDVPSEVSKVEIPSEPVKSEEPKVEEPTKVEEVKVEEPKKAQTVKKEKAPKKVENKSEAPKAKVIKEKVVTKRPKTKTSIKVLATISCILCVLMIAAGIGCLVFAGKLLEGKPDFSAEKLQSEDSSTIYDKNGDEIVELGLYLRENIEYQQMPNCLIDAFLSIEDSRYFEHFGFDIPRFTKAIIENLKSGDFGQGGSTITMQLVKNSYFQVDADGDSTLAASSGMAGVQRKMQEIILAMEADKALSKQDIIALYINKINFGNNIRGVQKAAEYYFGKDAKDLNLVESAFLAGIINAPNNYNPYNELYKNDDSYVYLNSQITYLENAQERTAEVLDLMVYHGYISQEEATLAKSIKIEDLLSGVDKKFSSYSQYYQDFIDAVIDEAEEVTGKDPYTTAMEIYTSMDPYMQEVLYNIENENTDLTYHNDLMQSALVVLNNQTGELIALGGGRNQDEQARQFNRATSAYLQPGSSIKPVIEYALAFDRLGWSTAHTITDKPYYLYNGDVLVANAGSQGYTGDMLITEAIARSLNTPAVQTLAAVIEGIGEDGVKEYLQSIGITKNIDTFDLQWAIGGNTCVVTPVQLAAAHAIFMNEGYYVTPHTIKSITFSDGSEYVADTEGTQVISSAAAFMMAYCEEYNVSGPFRNNMQILKKDHPVYAKTGTTDWSTAGREYGIPTGAPKDMWLMCQTSNYTVTIWLGYDKAEVGAYFTSSQDLSNLKGKIGTYILDELDEHFADDPSYDVSGVKEPSDVTQVSIVKGAYPYCAPTGGYETVTGYIKASALEETPLTSVSSVLASLTTKPNSKTTTHLSGGRREDGVVYVSINTGGYYCSGGTQDLSATNYKGKTTSATGRCYFPHYRTTGSSSTWADVSLSVNGEYLTSSSGAGYVEFYDVPEGSVTACIYGGSICININ